MDAIDAKSVNANKSISLKWRKDRARMLRTLSQAPRKGLAVSFALDCLLLQVMPPELLGDSVNFMAFVCRDVFPNE